MILHICTLNIYVVFLLARKGKYNVCVVFVLYVDVALMYGLIHGDVSVLIP